MIRIASGQAFWGDWSQAPALQVRSGPIDYLVLDYLAEVTIAILDKQHRRDPEAGYARDFVRDIGELLPEISERGIRVVASAGGVNATGCAQALLAEAKRRGVDGLKIGVVESHDVLDLLPSDPEHDGAGSIDVRPLDADELPWSEVASRATSAHVYLGADPIVEALERGAQIVVTGRCTDTALVVAPLRHEFGITGDQIDALALGTVVGHVLECGAQASGGNFLGDWRSIEGADRIGFPIAEIETPDRAVITKHPSLGGKVSAATVKEQLLYEIGDPRHYITADCVADFTSIDLREIGPDRVEISGVRGRPAPERLKVSCVYDAGWKVTAQMTYCWPDAREKAERAAAVLRRRVENLGANSVDEWCVEVVGADACFRGASGPTPEPVEVVLRVAVRGADKEGLELVGREMIGLVLTGPPGATGYAGGRPKASAVRAIWSGLVPRDAVRYRVDIVE